MRALTGGCKLPLLGTSEANVAAAVVVNVMFLPYTVPAEWVAMTR